VKNVICKFVFSLFVLFSFACMGNSASEETIPLSIDAVSTSRVGENLIRVIRYNMELEPQITIERLSTPVLSLIESKTINSIVISGEKLDFNRGQGVFIEDFSIEKSRIHIKLEYFYPKGESVIAECEMLVTVNNFEPLKCRKSLQN